MADVLDVARYVLEQKGELTTLKLQKLVYYAQVWSIATDGAPLFPDGIEAWAQGPVVPALFREHKGRRKVQRDDLPSGVGTLTQEEQARIDEVLVFYGDLPAAYLGGLTRHELPWKMANKAGEEQGWKSPLISVNAIRNFYDNRTPEELASEYQMAIASELMDEHAESLSRLAQ